MWDCQHMTAVDTAERKLFTHACAHTYKRTRTHTHIHTHAYPHTYTRKHTQTHTPIDRQMFYLRPISLFFFLGIFFLHFPPLSFPCCKLGTNEMSTGVNVGVWGEGEEKTVFKQILLHHELKIPQLLRPCFLPRMLGSRLTQS